MQEAIVHGEADGKTFYEMMEQAEPFGWTTFDSSISRLYQHGKITEETALAYATRHTHVKKNIDQDKIHSRQKTTDIEGLKMDHEYRKNLGV